MCALHLLCSFCLCMVQLASVHTTGRVSSAGWSVCEASSVHTQLDCTGLALDLLVQAKIPLPEAMWSERDWFANNTRPGVSELPNVGVHYLLWRVQDWLIPQINRNLADITETVRVR